MASCPFCRLAAEGLPAHGLMDRGQGIQCGKFAPVDRFHPDMGHGFSDGLRFVLPCATLVTLFHRSCFSLHCLFIPLLRKRGSSGRLPLLRLRCALMGVRCCSHRFLRRLLPPAHLPGGASLPMQKVAGRLFADPGCLPQPADGDGRSRLK
jgi:hypothetical protein